MARKPPSKKKSKAKAQSPKQPTGTQSVPIAGPPGELPPPSASPMDKTSRPQPEEAPANFIPDEVSRRMMKRVMVFSGIPTFIGFVSFFVNYYLLTQTSLNLPPYFTLIETFTLFGLGFVGISYGVLSASWDTEPGSRLGFSEFRTNLGNMTQAWRAQGTKKRQAADKSSATKKDPK